MDASKAYGAAHTLQEILTVKSDDISGRVKTYEAIVKGKNIPMPGAPEAFHVLIRKLQSLALSIRVFDDYGKEVDLKKSLKYDSAVDIEGIEQIKENKEQTTEKEEKNFNPENIFVEKGQEY